MLAEYLTGALWHRIMPGVSACQVCISQAEDFPVALPLRLDHRHYEVLFCRSGSLLIGRQHASPTSIGGQEILLLTDCSDLTTVQVTSPLSGVCLSISGPSARESAALLSRLLGDVNSYLEQFSGIMQQHHGCCRIHSTSWTRSVFSAFEGLSDFEQERYCAMKTLELLYLICTHSELLQDTELSGSYLSRTVLEMQSYMESHLDEKLTITAMSRHFNISPTAFKSSFRSICGQPVHSWLQNKRMQRAAEFLTSSPMTVLQIAQSVGYEGVSQFNVVFKRFYGVTPSQYRKLSEPGKF